jgi:integrase
MPITIKSIQSLAPGGVVWDEVTPGFGVRRQAKAAVFFLKYRVNGIQRLYTIGRYGAVTPDKARREARRILGLVASGNDPQRNKVAARSGTMLRTIEAYLARAEKRLRPRSFHEVRRHLLVDWKPLHSMAVQAVTRKDVAEGLREIETRGPVAAIRARATLSSCFSWAIKEGIEIATNPVQGTNQPVSKSRERVLSRDELASVWHGLGPGRFSDIVRLLVLTGQRRSEIGGLRWDEVTNDSIVLPGDRTKNGRVHVVPLSPLAAEIINQQERMSDFVFGMPWTTWSAPKAALNTRVNIAPWTLHDLRRSVATGLAELGTAPHIVKALLNHVSGHKAGVAGIYNRARYADEVRAALDRWAGYVAGLGHV